MTVRPRINMTDPALSQTFKGWDGAGSVLVYMIRYFLSVMSVSYMFPYQSSSSGASSVDSTFGGMA